MNIIILLIQQCIGRTLKMRCTYHKCQYASLGTTYIHIYI